MAKIKISTARAIGILKHHGTPLGLKGKANQIGFYYRIKTEFLLACELSSEFDIKEDVGTEYTFVTHFRKREQPYLGNRPARVGR